MTVRHMEIFTAVFRQRSITKAAQVLHITQPAVSKAIKELENYYGVRLFERINRTLYVTDSGRQLFARAEHIVESFDLIEKELKNGDEFGILRIGAGTTPSNFLLPELLTEFKKTHPHIKVSVYGNNDEGIQKHLFDNRLDISFTENGVFHEDLISVEYSKDRLKIIVPPGHPLCQIKNLRLADIIPYDIFVNGASKTTHLYLEQVFARHGFTLEPMWEMASMQAIIKAVIAGLGISILPEQFVRPFADEGKLCILETKDEEFLRSHYIIWHKNKFLTSTMKDFIALCHKISNNRHGIDRSV